jgi:prophage antirepressor-like protein
VITIDDQPWFVAMDVYEFLYGRTTGVSARYFLDADEINVIRKASASGALTSLFVGRSPRVALVSESGLYKLIMRSDKPEAKPFQDWVTKVVLPAIRKDGGYVLGREGGVWQGG